MYPNNDDTTNFNYKNTRPWNSRLDIDNHLFRPYCVSDYGSSNNKKEFSNSNNPIRAFMNIKSICQVTSVTDESFLSLDKKMLKFHSFWYVYRISPQSSYHLWLDWKSIRRPQKVQYPPYLLH